jgi:hypothetical protein
MCFATQSITDQTNCSKSFVFKHLMESNKVSQIQQLNSTDLLNCTELTFVNSNFNSLSGNLIGKFQKLKKITASKSGIETISLFKSDSLHILTLDHNQISSLNDSSFENTTNLQTLDLSHNRVSLIQDKAFFGLQNLTSLKLSHNQLVVFKLDWFNNYVFKELELQKNQIVEIASEAVCDVKKANVIKLSHNNLTDISGMKCFHRIAQLRLSNNRKLKLNATHFKSFAGNLTELYVNGVGQLQNIDCILNSMHNLKILAIGNFKFETMRNFTSLYRLLILKDRKQEIDYKQIKKVFPNLNDVDLRNNSWKCEYRTQFVLHLKSVGVNVTFDSSKIIGTDEEVIIKIGCHAPAILITPVKVMWMIIIVFIIILLFGIAISCKYHLSMRAQQRIRRELRKSEFMRYRSIQYPRTSSFELGKAAELCKSNILKT